MARCAACGAEVKENVRYCPHCGAEIREDDGKKLRDYWAEQLAENQPENAKGDEEWTENTEDEEDWTEDVEEGDLRNLNEDRSWDREDAFSVKPAKKRKFPWGMLSLMLLLGIFLIMGLTQIRREEIEDREGAGVYYGFTETSGEKTKGLENCSIELKPDDTFQMHLWGRQLEGRWKLEGENFCGYMDHRDFGGRLKNGILSLDYAGSHLVFALPEMKKELLEEKTEVTLPGEEIKYAAWTGDYYGSMILSQGTGAWEGNSGDRFDVCGRILADEKDQGTISLWNDQNRKDERFLKADILFSEGTTDLGKFSAQWGKFYDMELGPGEWVADPGKSPCSHLKNMLYLRGMYMDPQNPGNTFTYEIFLKPWGESWQDVLDAYADPCMLPPGYESFYLPLIGSGQRMPEHF